MLSMPTKVFCGVVVAMVGLQACRSAGSEAPKPGPTSVSTPAATAPRAESLVVDFGAATGFRTPPPLLPGEEKAILDRVFPRRPEACSVNIEDSATGAFTAAARNERVYIVVVRECIRALGYNARAVVADVGGTDIKSEMAVEGPSIARVVDLDRDGVSELIMTGSGGTHQGITHVDAYWVSLAKRAPTAKKLGEVIDDSCGSGQPGSTSTTSSLYASIENGAPSFRLASRVAACPLE